MNIELGTNPILANMFYEIVHKMRKVQLDSSTEARYQNPANDEQISVSNRVSALFMLCILLNKDNSTTFANLTKLVQQLNEDKFDATDSDFTKLKVPMYLAEIVDQYSSGLIAYPLILLDTALFCELVGAAGKSINGDFTNGLKIKALKTVAEGIKYLNLNSKKVNVKKNSQCIEEMLVKTAHF